jgi:uncharacterized membrane protein YfcA
MQRTLSCPFFRRAFGWSIPIGGLGGLIGLGSGEFRLPVLMYGIGFDAKSAVPLNLMASLVTLAIALASRSRSVSMTGLGPHLPEIFGLAVGGLVSAFYGASFVKAMSSDRLVQLIAILLMAIGGLLLVEAIWPFQHFAMVPDNPGLGATAGCALGVGIGLVSRILGSRWWRTANSKPHFPVQCGHQECRIGEHSHLTWCGRYGAVAYAPVAFLKLFLGAVLVAAALKTIASHRQLH